MKKIINNIDDYIDKHSRGIFLILIILFILCVSSTYIFTTFPLSSGWGQHYSNLMLSGKVPYKDFYYYLPPYNLLLDTVIWKLSCGHFIVYVLFRLVERVLIFSILFKLLCKFVKPKHAFISTICSYLLFIGTVYDLIGDYNQTMLLFAVLLTYSYIKFAEYFKTDNKKQYRQLFISGLLIGLSFTLKQPLFLSEVLIFFPILTFIYIFNKRKDYFKSLAISVSGILIPIIITLGSLFLCGAAGQFMSQVYLGGSGKGGVSSLITVLIDCCINFKFLLISSFIIAYFYLRRKQVNVGLNDKEKNYLVILVLVSLVFSYLLYTVQISNLDVIFHHLIGYISLIIIFAICIIDRIILKKKRDNNFSYITLFFGLIFLLIALIVEFNYAQFIYLETSLFGSLPELCTIITTLCIIFSIYLLSKNFRNKELSLNNIKWLFLILGGILYEYSCAMGSLTTHVAGATIILALLVSYILDTFANKKDNLVKISVVVFTVLLSFTIYSQKIAKSYSWWGWDQKVLDIRKLYSIDIPGLEGYRVSRDVKTMYEEMYKVIKENTNDDSIIYGFPYNSVFNVLLNNNNLDVFVPVPWYDVCSDEYAIKDANTLSKKNPDIVIWYDIPGAIEAHEELYRHGDEVGQRQIINWFIDAYFNKKYILIGQYNNLFIYKLNDGSSPSYTYIKKAKAKNKVIAEEQKKREKMQKNKSEESCSCECEYCQKVVNYEND